MHPDRGDRVGRETLVGLPRDDRDKILAIVNRRGGRDVWGLRELIPGELHADPAVLLERLLPDTVNLLNQVMAKTPFEESIAANPDPDDLRPPFDASLPFADYKRQSIRWQLGL